MVQTKGLGALDHAIEQPTRLMFVTIVFQGAPARRVEDAIQQRDRLVPIHERYGGAGALCNSTGLS